MSLLNTKTPVMILQELMIKENSTPRFDLIHDETGTHEPEFHYYVSAGPVNAVGIGRSKKEAKHEAARKALDKLAELGKYTPHSQSNKRPRSPSPCGSSLIQVNHVGALKDYCAEKKLSSPVWDLVSDVGPPHARQFTYQCIVGTIKISCTNSTKKLAKQDSARKMLHQLMDTLNDSACVEIVPLDEFEKYDAAAYSTLNEIKNRNPNKMRVIANFHYSMTDFDKENREKALEILEAKHDSLLTYLTKVGEILDFEVTISSLPSGTDNLIKMVKLSTDPEFIYAGLGVNEESAVDSALMKAISSLKMLLSD